MKTTILYRTLLISILILLSNSLAAQCPFTASIKLTDVGGCNGVLGRVEFDVEPESSSKTLEIYYIVYEEDGTTLVNSATNTNPKVSLAPGKYVGKVIAHCSDGQQTAWTKEFEIKQTNEKTFSVAQNTDISRTISLKSINTAMLAFNIEGLGMPVTAKIVEYPTKYTGPKEFEITHPDTYYVESLAAGIYKVEFSNGCVPDIVLSGLVVSETLQDLPSAPYEGNVTLSTHNEDENYPRDRPGMDHKKVFFSITTSTGNVLHPVEYWGREAGSPFYEYTYTWGTNVKPDAQSTWYDSTSSTSLNQHSFFLDCPIVSPQYTVAQMTASAANRPTIFFRVKGGNPAEMIEIKPTFRNTASSSISNGLNVAPSLTNCDNRNISALIRSYSHATFPFRLEVVGYQGSSERNVVAQHTFKNSNKEDLNLDKIDFPEISIPAGYTEVRLRIVCLDPTNETTVVNTLPTGNKASTALSGSDYSIGATRQTVFSHLCQQDKSSFRLTNSSLKNFEGFRVQYVGNDVGQVMPADLNLDFTVPSGVPLGAFLYLTLPTTTGLDPWSPTAGNSNANYHNFAPGKYTWRVTPPCPGAASFTIVSTLTAHNETAPTHPQNFRPVLSPATDACNRVQIDLGTYQQIKDIYSTNQYGTSIILATKTGNSYRAVAVDQTEVFYDGGGINFSTIEANEIYTNPKIQIGTVGEFYLFAVPNPNVRGTTNSSNPIEGLQSCMLVEKIVITEEDLGLFIDTEKTGAFFCSDDETMGNIFITRKGLVANDGDEYTFTITNVIGQGQTLEAFSKVIKSKELSVAVTGVDIQRYGTTYNVLIDAPAGQCTSQGVNAELNMDRISNSTTFISQNKDASCDVGVELEITAIPYSFTSYEWFNSSGASLGTSNTITGTFKIGDVLTLRVQFNSIVGSPSAPCSPWTIKYVVKGNNDDYYWKVLSGDTNWNNLNNWTLKDGTTPTELPGACSSVHIPSMSTQFPDLKNTTPRPTTTDIYFEFGAQLYNQQVLQYENAHIQYNFAYYDVLNDPAPTSLVQPDKTVNTQATDAGKPFNEQPKLERARWYMLSTPLKDMISGDFQFGGKPFVTQKYYSYVTANPSLMIKDGFVVKPEQDIKIESVQNAIAIWMAPHAEATGAKDQSIVQDLKGALWYPYTQNSEILNIRTDRTFNSATNTMQIKGFDMETLASSTSTSIIRSTDASRFVYEDNTGNIPAGGYTVNIAADPKRTTGEVMIGNPFMAPIDFDKFVTENANIIENTYKIISSKDNGVEKEYVYPTTVGFSSKIAVQQAFIIKLKNPTAAVSLKFPTSVMADQSAETSKLIVL